MNNKLSIREVLSKDGELIYTFSGNSMLPLLDEETSHIKLVNSSSYELYDVVLYQNEKGTYILHRIVKIKKDTYYIAVDNSNNVDKVNKKDILAKMVGYYKGEKYISISDSSYQDYLSSNIIGKDYKNKEIINNNDINKSYYLNDAIKKAYHNLYLYSVSSSKFDINSIFSLSKEDFYNFYLLSIYKKSDHVLAHIVNKYKLDIDGNLLNAFNKTLDIVKNRYLYQDYYKNELSVLLAKHKIKHMFFRGSELKDRFNNPILRMSNDIDLYVSENDLKKTEELIIDKYHPYIYDTHTVHHTFNIPHGHVQIELHYALLEDYLKRVNDIIGDPFLHSNKDENNPYLYHMDKGYYYLYHLAHFAKHIKSGEYWLSMLQDSYLLKDDVNESLIKEAGLETFYLTIKELLDYYEKKINITQRVMDIEKIIYNDAFNNYVMLNQKKYSNKFIYILRRVFLTPKELSTTFPQMKGREYLYPYYFVKRLFHKKKNKPSNELKTYNKLKKDNLDKIYQNIGISF